MPKKPEPPRRTCVNCGAPFYAHNPEWTHCKACARVMHPGSAMAIGRHFVSRTGERFSDVRHGLNSGTTALFKRRAMAQVQEQIDLARIAAKQMADARDRAQRARRAWVRLQMLKKVHAERKAGKVRGYMDFSKHDAAMKARAQGEGRTDEARVDS